jgi:hypothetical protein
MFHDRPPNLVPGYDTDPRADSDQRLTALVVAVRAAASASDDTQVAPAVSEHQR